MFEKRILTINEHIKNIFLEGELIENSVIRKFRITVADGKNGAIKILMLRNSVTLNLKTSWEGSWGRWFTDLEARLPKRGLWFTKGGNWSSLKGYKWV